MLTIIETDRRRFALAGERGECLTLHREDGDRFTVRDAQGIVVAAGSRADCLKAIVDRLAR